MNKIFLARLEFGSYLLQALGETEEQATNAIRKEWEEQAAERTLMTHGYKWDSYAEHFGLWVAPMILGQVEWH
jgi:hypothetical protein